MDKCGKFYECRQRLDKTLASPELTNLDSLKTLISKQLEGCNEELIKKRATEASNFLHTLRSAAVSGNEDSRRTKASSPGEWNLKESNEEFRVMYREGPPGTPMHTLFVEGYVDGPIDTCLCIGWESTLYDKWWPKLNFPNFKITISKSLQKVRFGEQISLQRVKTTWPLSARESVLHYFMFEYLQEGLVVVLLNSISDSENLDITTHGFTRDGIPKPEDVVRMDLVGGFAMQRINSEQSYVCLIGNIDFKLDLVPPTLINFVARQLIGGGYKLYQKAVVSTSKRDKDYIQALKDPMYARLRNIFLESNAERQEVPTVEKENSTNEAYVDALSVLDEKTGFEDDEDACDPSFLFQYETLPICPDMKLALASLERATSTVRRYGADMLTRSFSRVVVANPDDPMEETTPKFETLAGKESTLSKVGVSSTDEPLKVSEISMENAPPPIKCPADYKSWSESDAGSTRDGESRNVVSSEENDGNGCKKKGRKQRKRRFWVKCFGYSTDRNRFI